MNQEELENIIDLHSRWLFDEDGGKCADLCGADLINNYLRDADLRGADLCGANLLHADLQGANLQGANFQCANLCNANLCSADLRGAELRGANLHGADLCNSKLSDLALARTCICPEKGSFIAFKRACTLFEYHKCIVELEIPADAKRSNATGRKCRASKAKVISITYRDGSPVENDKVVVSSHDHSFIYEIGKTVEPTEPFDEDRWKECTHGIHFFITRQEAVSY